MTRRTESVRIRVSPEELARIRQEAEADGRTVSDYIRRCWLLRRPTGGKKAGRC